MKTNKFMFSIVACLLVFPFVACQDAPHITELSPSPSETNIPSTATSIPTAISTNTPIPPTPTKVLTDTSIPRTSTITALPEQKVTSIDQLVGVWRAKWDANYLQKFTADGLTTTLFEQYLETVEKELFTFEDGLLTWGDITFTIGEPQECLDNPVATYEVYITYRGDQPDSLRWVLISEEHCDPRFKTLTVFPYTWYGTVLP